MFTVPVLLLIAFAASDFAWRLQVRSDRVKRQLSPCGCENGDPIECSQWKPDTSLLGSTTGQERTVLYRTEIRSRNERRMSESIESTLASIQEGKCIRFVKAKSDADLGNVKTYLKFIDGRDPRCAVNRNQLDSDVVELVVYLDTASSRINLTIAKLPQLVLHALGFQLTGSSVPSNDSQIRIELPQNIAVQISLSIAGQGQLTASSVPINNPPLLSIDEVRRKVSAELCGTAAIKRPRPKPTTTPSVSDEEDVQLQPSKPDDTFFTTTLVQPHTVIKTMMVTRTVTTTNIVNVATDKPSERLIAPPPREPEEVDEQVPSTRPNIRPTKVLPCKDGKTVTRILEQFFIQTIVASDLLTTKTSKSSRKFSRFYPVEMDEAWFIPTPIIFTGPTKTIGTRVINDRTTILQTFYSAQTGFDGSVTKQESQETRIVECR